MPEITTLIFLIGLACLFNHELDAIRNHEWRFFFAPFNLSDEIGYHLFVILHLPLYIWIIAVWQNLTFQIGMDIFLMVHFGLHLLLRNHDLINFTHGLSWVWIAGGAGFGALHLVLVFLI